MHTVGRCVLFFFLLVATLPPVHAATFSLVVVERGLGEDIPTAEASLVWESGVMAVLFEAGHIVTNTPVRRNALGNALELAREGGAQYFLAVELNYDAPSQVSQRSSPRSVVLTVQTLDTVAPPVEERRALLGGAGAADDERAAQDMARAILIRMKGR